MIFYVCNGMKTDCPKTACKYLNKGECIHTSDEHYALYESHGARIYECADDGSLWEKQK